MQDPQFAQKILEWYHQNKRDLPWRGTKDPYKIWLSEIILQQTRVEQGLPYYVKFIESFPTVETLANAEEREILRIWQGLGYYSRARNLHRCAKIIYEKLDGIFPKTFEQLLKLPGIGPYTAAAIASFSFKEPVAVVDGNVYRVLSRVFGMDYDISSGKGQKQFQLKANELISKDHPDEFNQAIMEFGATHCTPKKPNCSNCIFIVECIARINQLQDQLPVKIKKTKVRKRYFHYLVFEYENKLWMQERKGKDIWQGLYDFQLIEKGAPMSLSYCIDHHINELNPYIDHIEESKSYKHILSHQHIQAVFFTIHLKNSLDNKYCHQNGLRSYSTDQILDLPKPVLISSYLSEYFF